MNFLVALFLKKNQHNNKKIVLTGIKNFDFVDALSFCKANNDDDDDDQTNAGANANDDPGR